jgi:hypothetical protein
MTVTDRGWAWARLGVAIAGLLWALAGFVWLEGRDLRRVAIAFWVQVACIAVGRKI